MKRYAQEDHDGRYIPQRYHKTTIRVCSYVSGTVKLWFDATMHTDNANMLMISRYNVYTEFTVLVWHVSMLTISSKHKVWLSLMGMSLFDLMMM